MSVLTSVSGFPRIGQNRELKKIIEAYWKGVATLDDVRATAKELRAKHWKLQQEAGIDLIPSNDFSYYDQMLNTAILLNVIPQRSYHFQSPLSPYLDSNSSLACVSMLPWAAATKETRATSPRCR